MDTVCVQLQRLQRLQLLVPEEEMIPILYDEIVDADWRHLVTAGRMCGIRSLIKPIQQPIVVAHGFLPVASDGVHIVAIWPLAGLEGEVDGVQFSGQHHDPIEGGVAHTAADTYARHHLHLQLLQRAGIGAAAAAAKPERIRNGCVVVPIAAYTLTR